MGQFSVWHWLIVLLIALPIYLIPYFIARSRGVASRGWLLVVNILFGFMGVGWLISMIWAIFGEKETRSRSA